MGSPPQDRYCRTSRRALDAWASQYFELRVHRWGISSTGARHANDRCGNSLRTAPNPPCCEWAVHRGDAEAARLPIAREDIAGRGTSATFAVCDLYIERSNAESGSRSVHRAPSRLRPLNVIWSIASNQPHPAAILLRSICRHRSPAEARSRSPGCPIGDTPSVRVPPDDLPRMSPSGPKPKWLNVRFWAAVGGQADIKRASPG